MRNYSARVLLAASLAAVLGMACVEQGSPAGLEDISTADPSVSVSKSPGGEESNAAGCYCQPSYETATWPLSYGYGYDCASAEANLRQYLSTLAYCPYDDVCWQLPVITSGFWADGLCYIGGYLRYSCGFQNC
jgi:hypothetical protein